MLKLLHVYNHPCDGHIVVIDVEFFSVSKALYTWKKVNKNGTVSKDTFSGVGGYWKEVTAEVILKIKFTEDSKNEK